MFTDEAAESAEYWQQAQHLMLLLSPAEASPLEHQFKYQDPECDIVQSAAVGTFITAVCEAFRERWRYALRTPAGIPLAPGMIVIPKVRSVVIVRPYESTKKMMSTITYSPTTRYVMTGIERLTINGRHTGQFVARLTTGGWILIDHRFFDFAPPDAAKN
jgi:hypothetical protein